MEDRERLEAGSRASGWVEAELQALARPAILLVEDEGDIKPFDLDDLVNRVRQRLEAAGGGQTPKRVSKASKSGSSGSAGSNSDHHDDCPDPIELILYVSADSPRTASAIEQIKSVLSHHKFPHVRLTICDLSKDPEGGNADGIAFTPTLVKRSPGPRTRILGHITNPELLLELLEGCGED